MADAAYGQFARYDALPDGSYVFHRTNGSSFRFSGPAAAELRANIDRVKRLSPTAHETKTSAQPAAQAKNALKFDDLEGVGYGPGSYEQPKPDAGRGFVRSAAASALDAAAAPVKMVGMAAEALGYPNAAANLEGSEAVESVEWLRAGKEPTQVRRENESDRAAYPTAVTAGEAVGGAVGGSAGGALSSRLSPGVGGVLRVVSPEVARERMGRHQELEQVQRFLNQDRSVGSQLEARGFDDVANRYGVDRAKSALGAVRGTQRALKDVAKESSPEFGTVYRGVTLPSGEADAIVDRGSFRSDRIWSTSSNREAAASFATRGKGDEPVLFEIKQRSAVPTDAIPGSETFEEALLPSRTQFRVLGERKEEIGGKPVRVIQVEEALGIVSSGGKSGKTAARDEVDRSLARAAKRDAPVYTVDAGAQDAAKSLLGGKVDSKRAVRLIGTDDRLPDPEFSVHDASSVNGGVRIEMRAGKARVEHEFYRDPQGKLVVKHELFKLPTEQRGQGVGKTMLRQQLQEYDRLGVDRIEMTAAADGRAVWPAMGFGLKRPTDFVRIRLAFDKWLSGRGIDPKTVPASTVQEVARFRSGDVRGTEFLLSPEVPEMQLVATLSDASSAPLRAYLGVSASSPKSSGSPRSSQSRTSSSKSAERSATPSVSSSVASAARSPGPMPHYSTGGIR